ncbi:glycosyl hydrolase [Granulicella sp. S190]|uniref:glycosyl hydrolase n=1 Tax=Granulicella sp. S190 TaxID=1747226 RepID=UPI00131AC983|nr:glycosyl hydrolase [Granulicella sp. S190]
MKHLLSRIPYSRSLKFSVLLLAAAFSSMTPFIALSQATEASALRQGFRTPPADARIMMRWWWFGPAVTKPEITHELEQMKAEGIGGVEIADLYALELDDPGTGFHNQPFLSDEHIAMLKFAGEEARRLGLRVDVTLGSGWPFGGPHIPITQNAGVLRSEVIAPKEGETSVLLPSLTAGEKLIAAFTVSGQDSTSSLAGATQIPIEGATQTRLPLPTGTAAKSVLFFISSRTGMVVKRPSVGAEGFVLDHYDSVAVANHLHTVGDRLLQAFPDQPPYAVFSDSLEVAGSNWTGDFLVEFKKRRGYDLTPHLPSLIGDTGADTFAVRHDWGKTLTELIDERYMAEVQRWAHSHNTQFRSQTYGNPPVTIASYRFADLIEGEGAANPMMWRSFSWTRWAASAGHIYDKPVVSSETWTWLHSPSFRAVPLDMKAEADMHFLQGINQLIGHGWPYSPENLVEPGQRMYAAASFNAHNPWSFAMPEVATYLQRVSYILRQGKPAANVALYMPNDDAWASFNAVRELPSSANPITGPSAPGLNTNSVGSTPPNPYLANAAAWGNVSIDGSIKAMLDKDLVGTILDAGFSLDFIDPSVISRVGSRYPVLVVPNVSRIDLSTYRVIESYAKAGGIVIAVGKAPSLASGLTEAAQDSPEIQAITQRLFQDLNHLGHLVQNDADLRTALLQFGKPEVNYDTQQSSVGFMHRKLPDGDLYFVANTSNVPQLLKASFAHSSKKAEWWDPFTGENAAIKDGDHITEMIEPYGSRLLYFSNSAATFVTSPKAKSEGRRMQMDISTGWKLTIGNRAPIQLARLGSWTDSPELSYFSGTGLYEKEIILDKAVLTSGPIYLDFGPTKPIEVAATGRVVRTQALLEAPVRDVAEVSLNGTKVGTVWCPPYRIDVSKYLHAGSNSLSVKVANTAINELSGETQPSLRLLRALHGNTFQPQDMDDLKPLSSGLLGPISLHSEATEP